MGQLQKKRRLRSKDNKVFPWKCDWHIHYHIVGNDKTTVKNQPIDVLIIIVKMEMATKLRQHVIGNAHGTLNPGEGTLWIIEEPSFFFLKSSVLHGASPYKNNANNSNRIRWAYHKFQCLLCDGNHVVFLIPVWCKNYFFRCEKYLMFFSSFVKKYILFSFL